MKRKYNFLDQRELTQFLTGWGINRAHDLSKAICGEFEIKKRDVPTENQYKLTNEKKEAK